MKKLKLKDLQKQIILEYNWKKDINNIESKLKEKNDKIIANRIKTKIKKFSYKTGDEWQPLYIYAIELFIKNGGSSGKGTKAAAKYISSLEDEV